MPSFQTHDKITLAFVAPTAAVAWAVSRDPAVTAIATAGLLMGGFMFGPDLDVASRQYRRWGPARFVWLPYRWSMRHRSRFSHGILLGTAIRVAYFLAVASLIVVASLLIRDVFFYRLPASPAVAAAGVEGLWRALATVPVRYHAAAFAGLWVGAASHTLADIVGSTLKAIWNAL